MANRSRPNNIHVMVTEEEKNIILVDLFELFTHLVELENSLNMGYMEA